MPQFVLNTGVIKIYIKKNVLTDKQIKKLLMYYFTKIMNSKVILFHCLQHSDIKVFRYIMKYYNRKFRVSSIIYFIDLIDILPDNDLKVQKISCLTTYFDPHSTDFMLYKFYYKTIFV